MNLKHLESFVRVAELGQAAARQAETLGYFPVWSFAHEPARSDR